jgi:hypothetical protein
MKKYPHAAQSLVARPPTRVASLSAQTPVMQSRAGFRLLDYYSNFIYLLGVQTKPSYAPLRSAQSSLCGLGRHIRDLDWARIGA